MIFNPKADVNDLIRIISKDEIETIYPKGHRLMELAGKEFMVTEVKQEDEDLYLYKIFPADKHKQITLTDCDFYVKRGYEWVYKNEPVKELFTELPVYLVIDYSDGMGDKLIFGEQALIDYAEVSREIINDNLEEIHVDLLPPIVDVDNAIEVLGADNYGVTTLEENDTYLLPDYIVSTHHIYNPIKEHTKILVHNVHHIYNLITRNELSNTVDLTTEHND